MPREDIKEEKEHEEEKTPSISLEQLTTDTKINMLLRNQSHIIEGLSELLGLAKGN